MTDTEKYLFYRSKYFAYRKRTRKYNIGVSFIHVLEIWKI